MALENTREGKSKTNVEPTIIEGDKVHEPACEGDNVLVGNEAQSMEDNNLKNSDVINMGEVQKEVGHGNINTPPTLSPIAKEVGHKKINGNFATYILLRHHMKI